ncbi:MAG TPA: hypothetical protein VEI97_06270 [bacterium]|nr:hypothetical protein [bacterium]
MLVYYLTHPWMLWFLPMALGVRCLPMHLSYGYVINAALFLLCIWVAVGTIRAVYDDLATDRSSFFAFICAAGVAVVPPLYLLWFATRGRTVGYPRDHTADHHWRETGTAHYAADDYGRWEPRRRSPEVLGSYTRGF